MVYLLGRIGDTKDALDLIIKELKDMQQAIAFCQEHDDPDLWNDLIDLTIDQPGECSNILHYYTKKNVYRIRNVFTAKYWNFRRSHGSSK